MIARQAAGKLFFQPPAAFVVLAFRTMAIAAATADVMELSAFVALVDGNAVFTGPAMHNGFDGFFVLAWHFRKPGHVLMAAGAEDFSNGAHNHITPITELMI